MLTRKLLVCVYCQDLIINNLQLYDTIHFLYFGDQNCCIINILYVAVILWKLTLQGLQLIKHVRLSFLFLSFLV